MSEAGLRRPDQRESRTWKKARIGLAYLLITAGVALIAWLAFIVGFPLLWSYTDSRPRTYALELGDLDGDGDLDAFYANGKAEAPHPNTVLINQGGAQRGLPEVFQVSDGGLGQDLGRAVTLADTDGDGDLDALVTGIPRISLYINDGQGQFKVDPNWDTGITGLWTIALGDLDGDNDLDVLAGGCCGPFEPFNLIWVNQGGAQGGQPGIFLDNGQDLEGLGAEAVALGDLDGDGDLDAFFGDNFVMDAENQVLTGQPNMVLWNDGSGRLADSGQRLGAA